VFATPQAYQDVHKHHANGLEASTSAITHPPCSVYPVLLARLCPLPPRTPTQRKVEAAMAEHKEKAAKRQAAEQQKQGWFDLKVNTSVYITGLPDDTTPAEVCAFFSKCGIVKLGDDGQPRIKLYK
jgi:hypothetical protein